MRTASLTLFQYSFSSSVNSVHMASMRSTTVRLKSSVSLSTLIPLAMRSLLQRVPLINLLYKTLNLSNLSICPLREESGGEFVWEICNIYSFIFFIAYVYRRKYFFTISTFLLTYCH